MIVCLCRNISSRRIEQAIADGADSVESVGRACGAGTDCGGCHRELDEMLARAEQERSGTRALVALSGRSSTWVA